MGSHKEKSVDIGSDHKEIQTFKTLKKSICWLGSLLVGFAGGFTLTWWRYKYHPDNRQLWMVPFGLVLLVTPAIALFSLVFSDIGEDEEKISMESQSVPSLQECDQKEP